MGIRRISHADELAPHGRWDDSGASIQARRTVTLLLPSETRTVSPSPTAINIAALALVVKQSVSRSTEAAFILSRLSNAQGWQQSQYC